MSVVINFQEIMWSPIGLKLPMVEKTYSLSQVHIAQADPADPVEDHGQPGVRLYNLSISRSREMICHLRVHEEDLNDLRVLQNLIFKSKF